jgi:hypothetical protein
MVVRQVRCCWQMNSSWSLMTWCLTSQSSLHHQQLGLLVKTHTPAGNLRHLKMPALPLPHCCTCCDIKLVSHFIKHHFPAIRTLAPGSPITPSWIPLLSPFPSESPCPACC